MKHLPYAEGFVATQGLRGNLIGPEMLLHQPIWARAESHRTEVNILHRKGFMDHGRGFHVPHIAVRQYEMRQLIDAHSLQKGFRDLASSVEVSAIDQPLLAVLYIHRRSTTQRQH